MIVKFQASSIISGFSPVNIPTGVNVGLIPKICLQRFFFKGCCKYGFDTIEGIQWLRLRKKGRGLGNVELIRLSGTDTVVLCNLKIPINVGTDGYEIQ